MMIPPLARTGPVPPPKRPADPTGYVVLTASGWHMAVWHAGGGPRLLDHANLSYIAPHDVLCWMPADGS